MGNFVRAPWGVDTARTNRESADLRVRALSHGGMRYLSLTKRLEYRLLLYSTSHAASGQFPIDHNGGQTANTVFGRPVGNFPLMHIVDINLVLPAGQLFHCFDRVFAGLATRAEDLDFVSHFDNLLSVMKFAFNQSLVPEYRSGSAQAQRGVAKNSTAMLKLTHRCLCRSCTSIRTQTCQLE